MTRRYRDLPIHAKLLVPFAILMIAWGGFGTAVLAHGTASESRARATIRLTTAFDGARSVVAESERNLLDTQRLVASARGLADAITRHDSRAIARALDPLVRSSGHIVRVYTRTTTLVYGPDRSGADIAGQTIVARAARGERDARGDRFAALAAGELLVAGPARDAGGRATGVVVVSDDLARIAKHIAIGTGAQVAIYSGDGRTLGADGDKIPYRAPPKASAVRATVRLEGTSIEALYGELTIRGERGGVIAVAFPSAVLLAGVQGKAILLALLVGAAVLVALGIGLLTARAITRPIGALVDATKALAQGDLHVRALTASHDEVGALAASFNAMADQLETSHRELESKVTQRTAQLRKANSELSRVSSAKSAFLATLSHELRTPLNGVIGFADMLSDPTFGEPTVEQTREIASNILTSGRHLLGLIEDLLDLAKIEAGKIDIRPQPVDLQSVVAEIETALGPLAREKRLSMTTALDGSLPAISADPARLRQILFNVIANAIKFTPPGGLVAVDATVDGSEVVVSVADTGPGLSPGDLERVFEPYERGEAGREQDGVGLGLALARMLIELQGGRIWASAALGHGSTFLIAMPIAAVALVENG